MPPVVIFSPYSGRPVKVREQDLGRAVRDEEGRVFYIVEDPEHGRYAARTRKGSDKDLQRYREMQAKAGTLDDNPAVQASRSAAVHDATGAKRRNPVGMIVLLIVLLVVAVGAYVVLFQPGLIGMDEQPTGPEAPDASQSGVLPSRSTWRTVHASFATSGRGEPLSYYTLALAEVADESAEPADDALDMPADAPAAITTDPRPVIVPTRTWRPKPNEVFVKAEPDTSYKDFRHTASGLRYKITHHTDGPTAKAGNYITVRYTAQTLEGEPLIDDARQSFVLMAGEAIRALDEGLAGLRAGEQLRMLVPRGHSTNGTLPGIEQVPDKPFLLDVQLVSIRPGVTFIVEQPGKVERDIAAPGDTVKVHYVARVEGKDGIIDATSPRGEPLAFTLGKRDVIPGLEHGLIGMRQGETRLLTIPPYLAYGDNAVAGGLIPAHAVLSFRVVLVGIERPE